MDPHQLTAFLAVAEEMHFGRAAERLHMAQPPLTRTIKRLERDLGVELFIRTTRSVRLTMAGQALIGPANDVLESCRVARNAVRAAGEGQTGLVRLGFAGPSSHLLVVDLSRQVRRRRPGIELRLRSTTYANDALRSVIDEELDLAIVRWRVRPPDIAQRIVAEERYVLVVPEEHRLADREVVSIAECRDEPFVALPAGPGSTVRETFLRTAYEAGFSPDIVQVASDSWTLMALVGAGVGLTFTLDTAVAGAPGEGIRLVRLAEELPASYARLAWRRDTESPALREVLAASEEALPTPEHLVGVDVP